jgi:galactokinase
MDIPQLLYSFSQIFKKEATLIVASPGRINLIGEHLDYNGGLVLPAAINRLLFSIVAKRADNNIHLYSVDNDQYFELTRSHTTDQLNSSNLGWPDFVIGVVDQLAKAGKEVGGFDMAITGNIPTGAGVSSSAAFECSVIFALNELFQFGLSKIEMVLLAQKAENEFIGVKCGVMDQFASVFGKENHVIKLNCNSLEFEYIPFDSGDYKIVLFDTHVKHSLASSEYNQRRNECEMGLKLIQKTNPSIQFLAEANNEMVEECIDDEMIKVKSRCKYVVNEAERIKMACIDLVNNDFKGFGKKMYATHEGLRKQYEVSCEELDFIVDACRNYPEVLGARMMGGGFGGCVIALIKESSVERIFVDIKTAYQQRFNLQMSILEVLIGNGTRIIYQVN